MYIHTYHTYMYIQLSISLFTLSLSFLLPFSSYLLLVPLQSLIDLSSLVNTAISWSDTSLVADSNEVIDFITGNVLLVSEVSVNDDDGVINDVEDEFILLLFFINDILQDVPVQP